MKIHEIISEQYDDELNEGPGADAIKAIIGKGIGYVSSIDKTKKAAAIKNAENKLRADKANISASNPITGLTGKALSKQLSTIASQNKAAVAAAKASIAAYDKGWWNVLEGTLGAAFIYDIVQQMSYLNDQYEKYSKGDRSTELFGNMSQEEADQLAYDTKKNIYGQAVIAVALITKKTDLAVKFLTSAGKYLGGTAGGVTLGLLGLVTGGPIGGIYGAKKGAKAGAYVGKMPPKLLKWFLDLIQGKLSPSLSTVKSDPIKSRVMSATAKAATLGGTSALLLFLQTDAGKKFTESFCMNLLFGDLFGKGIDYTWELFKKGLSSIGVDVGETAIKDPADKTSAQASQSGSDSKKDTSQYSGFRITKDPNNPKIVYYNDIQISDENGKQKVNDYMLDKIKRLSKTLNLPDPTIGITKW